jgi:hypothetical protein
MYKFTLTNLICPSQKVGTGPGGYHIKFRIDMPFNDASSDIKLSNTVTFQFTNLLHRVTNQISVNPVYDSYGHPLMTGLV